MINEKVSILLLLAIVGLKSRDAFNQQPMLGVVVTGIENINGHIHMAIYNKSEDFPKKGKEYRVEVCPVIADTIKIFYYGLPAGVYSIAFFHDTNKDGKCNLNFVGLPTEGFGFSNYTRVKFKPPSFDETSFYFDKDTSVSVKLFFIL